MIRTIKKIAYLSIFTAFMLSFYVFP